MSFRTIVSAMLLVGGVLLLLYAGFTQDGTTGIAASAAAANLDNSSRLLAAAGAGALALAMLLLSVGHGRRVL